MLGYIKSRIWIFVLWFLCCGVFAVVFSGYSLPIEAVLYPADTDYYFFYANIDTGETFFAETDEGHEANKDMVSEQQSDDDENGEE